MIAHFDHVDAAIVLLHGDRLRPGQGDTGIFLAVDGNLGDGLSVCGNRSISLNGETTFENLTIFADSGYTHNIINLSDTRDLVTVMWANEEFDPNKPDTFFEEV